MLKIKLSLISLAVLIGVFGAFAGRGKRLCESEPQYYKYGSTYLPAGEFGVDYFCTGSAGTCTYYLSNPFNPNSFAPCRPGSFSWLYK